MPHYRISEAAALLGVSDDTLRRRIDAGDLPSTTDDAGRAVVPGEALARWAQQRAATPAQHGPTSARNRLEGLVTAITTDAVMAQVELQCGPFRIVSLMSSEAVRDLGLEIGSRAAAVVKATTVIVEAPR
ncbi:TOBE domain-containing protein [Ruania suaedae]|uniref:TOBE domain-containing protein n=1 Tax=Ruania suaedae TaxID=2897774 RepID=UPI001E2B6A8E|nr:TOBE domain-containing protein [Ruania suaedae]UFU03565.1 TOBE domain-containing protein [Ruania suaedae]